MNALWKALLALVVIGVLISLATLLRGSRPIGSENLISKPLPDFAAPLASGGQNADANVFTPAQAKAAKSTAACAVELPGAFNSCRDLPGRAIITFWNTTKSACVAQVATLDVFVATHPRTNVVAVSFDQTESVVRDFLGSKDWKLPVAIDRDGAVAALYSVAGCPTTFFSRDGQVTGVELGVLTATQLAAGLAEPAGVTGATS